MPIGKKLKRKFFDSYCHEKRFTCFVKNDDSNGQARPSKFSKSVQVCEEVEEKLPPKPKAADWMDKPKVNEVEKISGSPNPKQDFLDFLDESHHPCLNLKPLFFEVPRAPTPDGLQEDFVGRKWLFREIYRHLTSDSSANRGVVISGFAGTGKTESILQLVKNSCFGGGPLYVQGNFNDTLESIYSMSHGSNSSKYSSQSSYLSYLSNKVVAYHFCQSDNLPTCMVAEFVHSLAAQMSQSPALLAYYHLISSDISLQKLLSISGCNTDPDKAFLSGILEPLKILQQTGQISDHSYFIIVVDGLCEAEIHKADYGDTITSFLSRHCMEIPHWLKVVCSVETSVLGITHLLPFHNISLDPSTSFDNYIGKDIVDYVTTRVRHSVKIKSNITPKICKQDGTSTDQRFIQFMVQSARGSFLYSKMILDLIERGHLVIKSSTSFNILPLRIAEIFSLELNLRFRSHKAFERVEEILAVLLAALSPMTPVEIFHCINASKGELESFIDWEDFVHRLTSLSGLLVLRADQTLMFTHKALRDFLLHQSSKGKMFFCNSVVGHRAIATKICKLECPLDPERTLDLCHHMLKGNNTFLHSDKSLATLTSPELWVAAASSNLSTSLASPRNISNPSVKISQLLLTSGASPNVKTALLDEAPILAVFSAKGYSNLVSLLLDYGADVNGGNLGGLTPIMFAARNGHLPIVHLLLKHGAKVNCVDTKRMSALFYAAKNGHLDIVTQLLKSKWLVESPLELGVAEAAQQAFVASAQCGQVQIVEYLLDTSDININYPDTLTGETALCAAAQSGHKDCCKMLLEHGASLTAVNLKQVPPLHSAIVGGHCEVVEFLIQSGANVEQSDCFGRTGLIVAAQAGHEDVVRALTKHGVSIRSKDYQGLTALSWACKAGSLNAVKLLIDYKEGGLNINHVDKTWQSPLTYASESGNAELVELLLTKGANMEFIDKHRMRPIEKAISCGKLDIVKCFISRGAKLGPTTWALAQNQPEILATLLTKLYEDSKCLHTQGRLEEAAASYQYAINRIPTKENVLANSKNQNNLQAQFDNIHMDLTLSLAKCLISLGSFEDAAEKTTEALRLNDGHPEALLLRSRSFFSMENYENAITDLRELLKRFPLNREARAMLNKAKVQLKKRDKENDNHNPNLNIQHIEVEVHLCNEKPLAEYSSSTLKSSISEIEF